MNNNEGSIIKFGKASQDFFPLSPYNFGTFVIQGKKWRTLVHFWGAMYFKDLYMQDIIRRIDTPEKVLQTLKRYGFKDFNQIEPKLLLYGIQERINQLDYVRDTLLCTGNFYLKYDGYGYLSDNNRYGKILMKVREIY